MRHFSITVSAFFISTILTVHVSSQSVFGFDVSNPNNTDGYMFNNANDAADSDAYIKNDPGIFDRVVLTKSKGYTFTVFNPSASRFIEVYDSLRAAFGYENYTLDSIPGNVREDDYIDLTLNILDGKARILRFWHEDGFNVKLDFSRKNLKVLLAYN